jgi:hypothetical protein
MNAVADIAHIIQLAVAPVFLLAGIGGILNVVAHRLARVVDRMRRLESDVPIADEETRAQEICELAVLDRRMTYCHYSVGLCVVAALLICLVVMVLFVSNLVAMDFGSAVSLLFVLAMVSLTAGLVLFLSEITVATRQVRVSDMYVKRRVRR